MKHKMLFILLLALLLPGLCCAAECPHEHTQVRGEVIATCTTAGYSGDIFCLDCSMTIQAGVNVTKGVHQLESEPRGAKVPSCTEEGYTGDMYCSQCSKMVIPGREIPMMEHLPGEPFTRFAYDPSCERDGLSPTVSCKLCYQWLSGGEVLPALGHVIAEPSNYIAPTCTSDGSCDGYCSRCEEALTGARVFQIPHTFENHICTGCGWAEPGLYDTNGQLLSTWAELLAGGSVTQKDILVDNDEYETRITALSPELTGRLVYPEGVKLETDLVAKTALTELWIPQDVTHMDGISSCQALEKVRIFSSDELWISGFSDNPKLREVVVSGECSLEFSRYAFEGCPALGRLVLPASLESFNCSLEGSDGVTVCYRGTQEAWERIAGNNAALNVIFEYTGE